MLKVNYNLVAFVGLFNCFLSLLHCLFTFQIYTSNFKVPTFKASASFHAINHFRFEPLLQKRSTPTVVKNFLLSTPVYTGNCGPSTLLYNV
jgi:hypothetical protein